MDVRVKDFFRIEIRGIGRIENFDESYFLFTKMIEFDVDVPELEGFYERITSLNTVATEKIDRHDVVLHFPCIIKGFEVYVKKLLYIIDRDAYKALKKKGQIYLQDVLDKLGIILFWPKEKQTKERTALYDTYKLRNCESHEYRLWSMKEWYTNLDKTLFSYLYVTEKVSSSLKQILEEKASENNYVFPVFKKFRFLNILNIPSWFWIVLNINDWLDIKCILDDCGSCEFDEDGYFLKSHSNIGDSIFDDRAKYEWEDGKIKRMKLFSKHSFAGKEDIKDGYDDYNYNDIGDICEIIRNRKQTDGTYKKIISVRIGYLADGGVSILYENKGRQQKIVCDCWGKIIEKEYLDTQEKVLYKYDSHDTLVRIEYPDYSFDEVKRIADTMFLIHKQAEQDTGIIREKRIFNNGRLVSIQHYNKGEPGKEWNYEYYTK